MKRVKFTVQFVVLSVSALGFSACDSGFGEPCEVPKTAKFEKACGTVSNRAPSGEDAVLMTSRASCAVKNFAGCSTRVCMVYRGSSPYCTTACTSSDDCEGSAVCRPLVGEAVTEEEVKRECDPSGAFATECYCVREGDAVSGSGATAAPQMSTPDSANTAPAPMTMPNSTGAPLPASGGSGPAAPPQALPTAGMPQ